MSKTFQGLRPIKPEEKVRPGTRDSTPGKKYCSSCQNEASQFAMFSSVGVTVIERYCDTCINQNKHILLNN
ncbi:MAG TPA: hypothetical protein VH415_08330 [Nitrososphaeraceae archaeon]